MDRSFLIAFVVIGWFVTSVSVRADPTNVRFATATQGGGFELFGRAAAEVMNSEESTLRVVVSPTKGSLENISLLARGEYDIGLVQGVAAHEAFAGIGQKPIDLKVIAAIYSSPGMFVVRSDHAARSVNDLVGKSIAWGTEGSGLTLMARYVMDGLGFRRDEDFKPRIIKRASEGPHLVLKGEVDALWGAGIGWPGFKHVMEVGGRLIGFTTDQVKSISTKHPFLKPMTVPAGAYKGQLEAVQTIGVWSYILARPDLPDDIAYRLARALHRGQEKLAARLPQARETTPLNTIATSEVSRIHPGVVKYLRNNGLLKAK